MKNYIITLSKTEIVYLFKYGYRFVSEAIEIENELTDDSFQVLTCHLNPFEYTSDIFLVSFSKNYSSIKNSVIKLTIEDVDHIYFLSEEKKQVGTNVLKLKMPLNYGSNYLRKKERDN